MSRETNPSQSASIARGIQSIVGEGFMKKLDAAAQDRAVARLAAYIN